MKIIELCPQCGEMMNEREGYSECISCGKRIEKKEAIEKEEKSLTFGKKFAISLFLDALDLTIFRIPVLGSLYDAFLLAVAVKLFGGLGFIEAWEFFDFTDQIDAEVPTLTLLCLLQYGYGKLSPKK